MKRSGLVLAAVALMAVLAGCGGDPATTDDTKKPDVTNPDNPDPDNPSSKTFTVVGCDGVQSFDYEQTRVYDIAKSNVDIATVSKPAGWQVTVSQTDLTVTAPSYWAVNGSSAFADKSGEIAFMVNGNDAIFSFDVTIEDKHGPSEITLTAQCGGGATRVSLNDVFMTWDEGDKVAIFDNAAENPTQNAAFTIVNGTGAQVGAFKGTVACSLPVSREIYAICPYDELDNDPAKYPVSIPQEQTYDCLSPNITGKYFTLAAQPCKIADDPRFVNISLVMSVVNPLFGFNISPSDIPEDQKVVNVSLTTGAGGPKLFPDKGTIDITQPYPAFEPDADGFCNSISVTVLNAPVGENVSVPVAMLPFAVESGLQLLINIEVKDSAGNITTLVFPRTVSAATFNPGYKYVIGLHDPGGY